MASKPKNARRAPTMERCDSPGSRDAAPNLVAGLLAGIPTSRIVALQVLEGYPDAPKHITELIVEGYLAYEGRSMLRVLREIDPSVTVGPTTPANAPGIDGLVRWLGPPLPPGWRFLLRLRRRSVSKARAVRCPDEEASHD